LGHWSSDAKYGYMFALRRRVEQAALAIGRARADSGPLAVRPGPLSQFATTRECRPAELLAPPFPPPFLCFVGSPSPCPRTRLMQQSPSGMV
jgi:hypothetical protein